MGEFCFACGLVSHTERFYRRTLDSRGESGIREWGNWLKALRRKVAGQSTSKWLRDDNDESWESRINGVKNIPKNQENKVSNQRSEIFTESGKKELVISKLDKSKLADNHVTKDISTGFNSNLYPLYGIGSDEYDGLQLEDTKRKSDGPEFPTLMDTEGVSCQQTSTGRTPNT